VQSVRVIEIEGWDRNACCGTHVRRTSAIGIVKLLGQERVTSGTRLHFVCGTRALKTAGVAQARLDALGRLLGCGASELEARCERLLAESRATRKEIEALQTALSESRATSLVAGAPRPGDVPLVVEALAPGAMPRRCASWPQRSSHAVPWRFSGARPSAPRCCSPGRKRSTSICVRCCRPRAPRSVAAVADHRAASRAPDRVSKPSGACSKPHASRSRPSSNRQAHR
jgi:hypothetical protein